VKSDPPLRQHVAELREAFDRTFAQEPVVQTTAADRFLAVRIDADRYALRLTDVAGLFADKAITWLPTPAPALLGLAAFRGTVMPVYDLGALLGYARASAPRWILLAAVVPVAVAVEGFEGYLDLQSATVLPYAQTRHEHIRDSLASDAVRPIIDLPSLLSTITDPNGHDRRP
jgi:purine-binding chemotaxis protein CheW